MEFEEGDTSIFASEENEEYAAMCSENLDLHTLRSCFASTRVAPGTLSIARRPCRRGTEKKLSTKTGRRVLAAIASYDRWGLR